jgi:hypothetical protein
MATPIRNNEQSPGNAIFFEDFGGAGKNAFATVIERYGEFVSRSALARDVLSRNELMARIQSQLYLLSETLRAYVIYAGVRFVDGVIAKDAADIPRSGRRECRQPLSLEKHASGGHVRAAKPNRASGNFRNIPHSVDVRFWVMTSAATHSSATCDNGRASQARSLVVL